MRTGELARRSGVSVRAIRHYDGLGLLSARRGENRYRIFTEEDAARVRLIRLFLSVGFRLEEIVRFAPCFGGGMAVSAPVPVEETLAFYGRKLEDIDAQLRALGQLRSRLEAQMQGLRALADAPASRP